MALWVYSSNKRINLEDRNIESRRQLIIRLESIRFNRYAMTALLTDNLTSKKWQFNPKLLYLSFLKCLHKTFKSMPRCAPLCPLPSHTPFIIIVFWKCRMRKCRNKSFYHPRFSLDLIKIQEFRIRDFLILRYFLGMSCLRASDSHSLTAI